MKVQNLNRSVARIAEREQERFASLQVMMNFRNTAISLFIGFDSIDLPDYLELTPIKKVYLCPDEIIMPYNKDYIIIAFDYEPVRTGMEIVKIPERYTTTHFKEHISLN